MTDKERMDRIRSRKSVLNPLVIILRAHFYTGYSPYVRSARPPPGHLNVRAVLRHYVPSKGLHPLRRYAAIPAGRQKILAVIFIRGLPLLMLFVQFVLKTTKTYTYIG